MIIVKLTEIHKDPENVKLKDLHEIYINIEGRVTVHVNSTLYLNESFPIVEFAVALNDWLRKPEGESFKYESMDDDDPDTFDIIAIEKKGYKLRSSWQETECNDLLSRNTVVKFIQEYTQQVKDAVLKQFEINLNERVGL